MGLDIIAYTGLRKIATPVFDADGYPQNGMRFYANPDFPGRESGLDVAAIYESEDDFDFRAGSYGGYNQWREQLAKLAGYQPIHDDDLDRARHDKGAWVATEGPFWELINFTDCEGVIGPHVAGKLAQDFAAFDEKAKAIDPDNGYFYERYKLFRKAFEMAAKDGAVKFT